MKSSINVFGISEKHLGEFDKPNEDAWCYAPEGIIALADGITSTRNEDRTYPRINARIASTNFVRAVVKRLQRDGDPTLTSLRVAIEEANNVIAKASKCRGITKETVDYRRPDYLGAVGDVLLINPEERKAYFAHVGDCVAMHLPKDGHPVLLTKDQLFDCHKYYYEHVATKTKSEDGWCYWQRTTARNKLDVKNEDGKPMGFGAFTGEPAVMDFLDYKEIDIKPGDLFLLSSDALKALTDTGLQKRETICSYESILQELGGFPIKDWPRLLVKGIRSSEKEKNARSDDATVVVVEVM